MMKQMMFVPTSQPRAVRVFVVGGDGWMAKKICDVIQKRARSPQGSLYSATINEIRTYQEH
jgi:hypothetical protein